MSRRGQKGKDLVVGRSDKGSFWEGKTPCWEQRDCISECRSGCGAYLDPSVPCWDHADTPCKKLLGTSTCFSCEIHHRYGPQPRGPTDS